MTLNLRNLQLPKLKLNELLINEVESEKGKFLFIYYCINNDSEHEKAVEIIKQEALKHNSNGVLFPFAFQNDKETIERGWTIIDKVNVYQNSDCNEYNRLVDGNPSNFERVYWAIAEL